MTITQQLIEAIASGRDRIGEILIQTLDGNTGYALLHHADAALASEPDAGGLEITHGPAQARTISLYAADGTYRFLKAQHNLRRGWLMKLADADELRLALDQFYPAAVGLWLAWRQGTLEPEHLRPKLNRQSGMYRRAKLLTDAQALGLVPAVCGAAPECARRILWGIDDGLPIGSGPVAERTGIDPSPSEDQAIPLLCAAPCNHFVAECLAAAKQQPQPTTP